MLVRLLLIIKHRFTLIWDSFELLNGLIFRLVYKKNFNIITNEVIDRNRLNGFQFRIIHFEDLEVLATFITKQDKSDLIFFNPHKFDYKSLKRIFKNPAFLMMGVFDGLEMVGYFFLRCFINKKCFVGRLVDKQYQGKGIGKIMNAIMYNIAWESGFRCLSTISKNNKAVIAAHAKNETMVVLKELDNDYMLVEFVERGDGAIG